MSPNLTGSSTGLFLAGAEVISHPTKVTKKQIEPDVKYEWKIVWRNVLAFIYLHVGALYGLYLIFTVASIYTTLFSLLLILVGSFGVTAGAHRLWAHKSYKAKWPLRVILAICQTVAFQNHIYEWVRDHRVHHKFTDTDADPHNSRRGFFFSHMGWLMVKKHTDVMTRGKTVDLSDLEKDWVVRVQRKFFAILMPVFCFLMPTFVPAYFWGENAWVSWYVAAICRYTINLNGTWLVNSAAHIWGMKPYDKTISPTENKFVGVLAFGEGWHNYHHAFPWDYKTSEFHGYSKNLTTGFIDFFAKIGWAYDLKTVPVDMIIRRAQRTGDGSRKPHSHDKEFWGWGDKDMTNDDKEMVEILHSKTE